MRKIRVCIYGGTDLKGTPTKFVATLADEILERMNAVIVTGGFLHSLEQPKATSTDYAALEGARKYARRTGKHLRKCFEAWVPDPTLDERPDVGGVVRMTTALGITVKRIAGRTPLGRRLAMVKDVDIVVTISGRRHTEVVGEQALEIGVPFLPIPSAGGDSRTLLRAHRTQIAARFAPNALDTCLSEVNATIKKDPRAAAHAVVTLLETAKVGRCLVLLPYDRPHNKLYKKTIEPAVSEHMFPLRLDQLARSDAIFTSFAKAIDDASAVIVDVTSLNENVMYEVGFAHARGLRPLLFTQDAARLKQLPVYLSSLNVVLAATDARLDTLIRKHLAEISAARAG